MDRRAGYEGCRRVRAKPEEASADRARHTGSVHTTEITTTEQRKPKRAMKLPPDMEFHRDVRLMIYRPKGLINEAEINRVIGVIEGIEAASQQPFNRFSDTSETHEIELNFRYVIHVSLHRRLSHKGRAPVKSAILATDSTLVHYAKLLALLTQGSSIRVEVFQDRKEAAQWLGVPLELLVAKSDDGDQSNSRK
jgi:hypothetical protein